jgi:DNA-binding protein YbaB
MTALWDKQIEQLAEEYQRNRAAALDFQTRLQEISATATSPKGLVTVVVGGQGELRSVVFHSRAYRAMAPAELAQVILETVDRARDGALRELFQAMPAGEMAGLRYEDVLNGRADVTALLPENPADADPLLFPHLPADPPDRRG